MVFWRIRLDAIQRPVLKRTKIGFAEDWYGDERRTNRLI